jgi:serine/threonine protein kinase
MKNGISSNDIKLNKKNLNSVKNRFLPLSESVRLGLEPEPKITDFKKKKEIGSGSFGRVYLATHIKTNVDYAIKVIDKRNKINIEGKPYFRREIEIMSKIRHPNCVRLFGNFEDENCCYFIMEYIPGGNLYTLMSNNRNIGLNIYLVASIVRDLASAIYYLHNMNPPIIHRDIKPENILLTNNFKIKLTDFGWSNYIDFEGEQRSTLCGTPIYLAPEMIQNSGHDKHVDIWCLGVLLFELLTGIPPFIGQNRILLMKNIINVNISWPMPPRLPLDPDAKDLISKILKKNPNERISLEDMIKHNFFIKYCPKTKPFFDKRQKFHSKPFIISKDIPKDDSNNDFDSINDNLEVTLENLEKRDENRKPLDIRHLIRTSQKKKKFREVTPEPINYKLCLEPKKNNGNNYSKKKLIIKNNKNQLRIYKNNQEEIMNNNNYYIEEINKLMKEKEKLEKDIEDYKLREIGYNKKIEELIFAFNNISQENTLLKLDLDKQRKNLEKKDKEINKLRACRKLNLNLNNQTTYNINTASNNNINMDLEEIRNNNYKEINNALFKSKTNRAFVSKTPEGLQRKGKRIILVNNSFMKPYMKKNAILNSKTVTQESWMKKDNKNSVIELGKLNKNVSYSDINKAKNKRIKFKRYTDINKDTNVEQNFKTEINEKEVIEQIKTGNDSLKMENIKFENFQINNIKSINNKNIDEN